MFSRDLGQDPGDLTSGHAHGSSRLRSAAANRRSDVALLGGAMFSIPSTEGRSWVAFLEIAADAVLAGLGEEESIRCVERSRPPPVWAGEWALTAVSRAIQVEAGEDLSEAGLA